MMDSLVTSMPVGSTAQVADELWTYTASEGANFYHVEATRWSYLFYKKSVATPSVSSHNALPMISEVEEDGEAASWERLGRQARIAWAREEDEAPE